MLKNKFYKKICAGLSMALVMGMLSACGQEQEPLKLEDIVEGTTEGGTQSEPTGASASEATPPAAAQSEVTPPTTAQSEVTPPTTAQSEVTPPTTAQSEATPSMTILADGSIKEQTFDVEISGVDGKVTFVPYAPTEENPNLRIEIKQNGEVLTTFIDTAPDAYAPDAVSDEQFTSLDAVAFYDVNYDSYTDIVLVETYGDTRFLAVYGGMEPAEQDYGRYFSHQYFLSEKLTEELNKIGEVSISELRQYLTDGKKNGEFSSYQEAYEAVCRLEEIGKGDEKDLAYNLIYFDEDDIPELVVGKSGYYVSMYTYRDGSVYMLMDHWAYGAMGNAGYEYVPYKNSLRNYNTDYAGAILYTTYMGIDENCSLESVAEIVTYNFDDSNQNSMLDEQEMASVGLCGVTYLNGAEVSPQECEVYNVGEYEYIDVNLTLEELKERL